MLDMWKGFFSLISLLYLTPHFFIFILYIKSQKYNTDIYEQKEIDKIWLIKMDANCEHVSKLHWCTQVGVSVIKSYTSHHHPNSLSLEVDSKPNHRQISDLRSQLSISKPWPRRARKRFCFSSLFLFCFFSADRESCDF